MARPVVGQDDEKWKSGVYRNPATAGKAGQQEYLVGEDVLLDAENGSGGRGPQKFKVLEARWWGTSWRYKLEDAKGKPYGTDKWFEEDDLEVG